MQSIIRRIVLFLFFFTATLRLNMFLKLDSIILISITFAFLILDFLIYYYQSRVDWFWNLETFTSGLAFGCVYYTLNVISGNMFFALIATPFIMVVKERFPHAMHKTEFCILFNKEDVYAVQNVLLENNISHTIKTKIVDPNDITSIFAENNLLYVLYVNQKDVEKAKKALL